MKAIAVSLSLMFAILLGAIGACGVLPVTPEQQIRDGANSVTVGATIAGSLLQVDKITKAQAVSYRAILGTAGKHLDTAFDDLKKCRAKTGSNEKTTPDPCKPSVQADIDLGTRIAADVKRTMDAK